MTLLLIMSTICLSVKLFSYWQLWHKTVITWHTAQPKPKTPYFLRIVWPCIMTNSLWIKPTDALNSKFIGVTTLHVSGSLSAHHQEFLAVHRHWYILCSFDDRLLPVAGSKFSLIVHFLRKRWRRRRKRKKRKNRRRWERERENYPVFLLFLKKKRKRRRFDPEFLFSSLERERER